MEAPPEEVQSVVALVALRDDKMLFAANSSAMKRFLGKSTKVRLQRTKLLLEGNDLSLNTMSALFLHAWTWKKNDIKRSCSKKGGETEEGDEGDEGEEDEGEEPFFKNVFLGMEHRPLPEVIDEFRVQCGIELFGDEYNRLYSGLSEAVPYNDVFITSPFVGKVFEFDDILDEL